MDERPESELRHFFEVLRRRVGIVILVMFLAVAAALAIAFTSTRIYAASARVLVTSTQRDSVFSDERVLTDPQRNVSTQIEVMQSPTIRRTVLRELGNDAEKVTSVTVDGLGLTDLIEVTVQSPEPKVAKRAADLYAETYVSARQAQQIDSLITAGAEIQQKIVELQAELDEVEDQIAVGRGELAPQRDGLAAQISLFEQRLDQLQVDAALKTGGAEVVATAEVPSSPVSPQPIRDGVLAGLLGLLLGVGIAFLAEYVDDKVNVASDVARYGGGLTVLAEIPAVGGWRDRRLPKVVALEDPNSPATEAYRSLRTSLQIIGLRRPVQTLLLTSPTAAEGKTTTTANLGVTLARAGKRVVLVDLDLRRPRLASFFDIEHELGFTSVLVGDAPLSEAIVEVPVASGVPPLQVLGSGPIPPNPAELMGTTRVGEVLASLQTSADVVLIDSPPIVPVTDALVLAGRVDGVLLVVGAGRTRRRFLSRATDLLSHAEAPLLGAILNATSTQRSRYGSTYGYQQRYAPPCEQGNNRRPPSRPPEPANA